MSDLLQRLRKAARELAEAGYLRDAAREQEAVAEIERLEAIVDRLPHTADGVPVVPGMRLWCVDEFTCTEWRAWEFAETDGRPQLLPPIEESYWLDSECYSTRAAAEAAGGE